LIGPKHFPTGIAVANLRVAVTQHLDHMEVPPGDILRVADQVEEAGPVGRRRDRRLRILRVAEDGHQGAVTGLEIGATQVIHRARGSPAEAMRQVRATIVRAPWPATVTATHGRITARR
jgi:hypothetical protein